MARNLEDARILLQDALDELSSSRSSLEAKTKALSTLERQLALASLEKGTSDDLQNFMALQYTFECNLPSRLLSWISQSIPTLESCINKGATDVQYLSQAATLAAQLSTALCLIQGVSLNHVASKTFLSRKYALEVLVDLLLASRHLSTSFTSPGTNSSQIPPQPPLSSVILDTFLCVLVDSSAGLRAFENVHGVQAIVKILKRAGTPREVRMKCLEFLYFYLLDEKPLNSAPSSPPTAPATPRRTSSKPFINSRPFRPLSRYGSLSESSASSDSSRSTSGSSVNSFSSASSSNTSISTAASYVLHSPDDTPLLARVETPPNSPPFAPRVPGSHRLQPRSLAMLRKEIDYVPQSPKKAGPRLELSNSRSMPTSSLTKSQVEASLRNDSYSVAEETVYCAEQSKVRTTEEKKEFLGTMLGNVDALVEGVRKAGIWGLG